MKNRNTTKKETPPREGLDSLLHRTKTSFLFLIPKDFEKFKRKTLLIKEIIIPPMQKQIIFSGSININFLVSDSLSKLDKRLTNLIFF